MAFQINSNVTALNVYNNLGAHQAKSSQALARISSGLKAAGGGDIASQGTAATLNSALQGTQGSISQVQSAINQLQAADAAYGELISLAQKGVEIASRGADAGADLSALHAALTANAAGLTSINGNTQFNGAVLLGTALSVDVGVTASLLVVTPAAAAAPAVAALSGTPIAGDIATTLGTYNTYVGATVDKRATNAGNIASLQNTLQVLNAVAANEIAGVGQAQDTDIAKEMMSLTSANIMTEAATAMLAQAMQLPNSVLKLLQ
jgi:flagellin